MDVDRGFLKQFCSEQLLCSLESFVPYEFTVLPSLKCLGRASFRLPLTNSYRYPFSHTILDKDPLDDVQSLFCEMVENEEQEDRNSSFQGIQR